MRSGNIVEILAVTFERRYLGLTPITFPEAAQVYDSGFGWRELRRGAKQVGARLWVARRGDAADRRGSGDGDDRPGGFCGSAGRGCRTGAGIGCVTSIAG